MAEISISLPDELISYLDRKVNDKSGFIASILQEWRTQQEAEELAHACAAVDELELGWTEEWETAAIIDSSENIDNFIFNGK
jgi:antitoxin ParD1/3/4